jgi:hypothetical protein
MQVINKLKEQFNSEKLKQNIASTSNESQPLTIATSTSTSTSTTVSKQLPQTQTQVQQSLFMTEEFSETLKSKLNQLSLHELQQLQTKHAKILSKIQKAIENKKLNQKSCLHCGQYPRSYAWHPCGHYNTCQYCAKKLISCPSCQRSGQILQIFE